MSPEERFQKIENALQTVAENQAAHDARMARIEELTEKNADGIRELIRLSGSAIAWQQAADERQRHADERLDRALERLDHRFDELTRLLEQWFRHRGPNGHEG